LTEGEHADPLICPRRCGLAHIAGEAEIELEVAAPATQKAVLDALEARYPMLLGTTRDPRTFRRRAFLRFYAGGQDLSDAAPEDPLPESVASGAEPYLVVGAIAGG
jgi:hypothetical protein